MQRIGNAVVYTVNLPISSINPYSSIGATLIFIYVLFTIIKAQMDIQLFSSLFVQYLVFKVITSGNTENVKF